jgi:hypothetical protein
VIVIERKQSMWLCATTLEAFEVHAVSLRLQGEAKNFEVFQRRLDNYETIEAGVISVFKCSDTTTKCEDCPKYITSCEVLKTAQATIKAHKEWAEWVESNGGTVF